jgi:outer membrane protein OmpA-like peptidoglycan-associated protein
MTKCCKTAGFAVLGLLLVPTAFAQQAPGQYASNSTASINADVTSPGQLADLSTASTITAPSINADVTAPAQPPVPFPAPAASENNPHIKPGTDYNHWDIFGGYAYARYRPAFNTDGITYGNNGGGASITYYVNRWFGLTFDFSGTHSGDCENDGLCMAGTTSGDLLTYMGGARFRWLNGSRWTPFLDAEAGGVHGTNFYKYAGGTSTTVTDDSQNAFGFMIGGGFDLRLTRSISWRVVQTDYLYTHFDQPTNEAPNHQNSIRVETGIVFTFGRHPEMQNRPPTVSLSADKTSIIDGSGDTIHLHAAASDPDGDTLTYAWSQTCGNAQGSGADAQWSQSGAGVGTCTVTVRVDDGHGGNASASLDLHVEQKPAPKPPVLSCSVDRGSVMAGERVTVTGNGSSPENFNLTYSWRANAGQVSGNGASVTFDTTGLAPGTYTITGRVDDGHGGAADCQASVTVQQPPPPPQASKINECNFRTLNSSRVDNVCKRVLDDVAVRLQNDPKGTVVIVGYADPKERRADRLATARGNAAVDYLASKGIDKSRISVRPGTGQAGAGAANRRIEIIWVPEGATY